MPPAHTLGSTRRTLPSPGEIGQFESYHEHPLIPLSTEPANRSKKSLIPSSVTYEDSEQSILPPAPKNSNLRLGPYRRFNCGILLPALATSLITAGLASALLIWLLSRRVDATDNKAFHHAIVAAESRPRAASNIPLISQIFGVDPGGEDRTTMYGLAMSSVAAHLVSFTTPFVLSVFAYSLASMWIEQQTRGRDGSLPTPTQYGHLVGLCGAFGLSSVYDAGKYLALGRKKRQSAPMALVAAFLAALVALLINYALSLSDLWLHTTATTFDHTFQTTISLTSLPPLGTKINTALCPGPVPFLQGLRLGGDITFSNCQHSQTSTTTTDMSWGNSSLINEGAAVLANLSGSSQIQFIGNYATLLPKTFPSGVQNMIFRTLGMEAPCTPITNCQQGGTLAQTNKSYFLLCPSFTPPFTVDQAASSGAMSTLNQFDIAKKSLIFQSGTPNSPAAAVGPKGMLQTAGYFLNATLNPAGVLVSLYWESNVLEFPDKLPGWYGFSQAPVDFTSYVSTCTLDVWDIELSYNAASNKTSPSFTPTSPPIRADFNTTSALLGALDAAYSATLASHLTTTMQASADVTADTFSNLLARNVSQALNSVRVSRYPLAPLCAVLSLAYGYALLALAVGIAGFALRSRDVISQGAEHRKPKTIREIELVHLRLTSARACVADRFDDATMDDPTLSAKTAFSKKKMAREG
ncbi:hypothetical protein C8J57DRAFT_1720493 [Mycena rebaudengoi]|nr:hypothetical protein C8J57DRAFT_1720493 [Mycena rebaudengoi]